MHCQGLTPGFHRLSFEQGRVLLTLCIGEVEAMLRELDFSADAVFLDAASQPWELGTLKTVARLCRRGTRLVVEGGSAALAHDLATCGFAGGEYAPRWQVKSLRATGPDQAGDCVVVGAGLAGAASAASLARRGWRVTVLDTAPEPAAGASALPVGLLAPHQSPDDNLLSRLSRVGVRMTLQACADLLGPRDWSSRGVLEHRLGDSRGLPAVDGLAHWTRAAGDAEKLAAGLAADEPAWWHASAAWIHPAALVRAWLAADGVTFRGGCKLQAIVRDGRTWLLRDAGGATLARAELVVVAAAHASSSLLAGRIATHPVRGQISWGLAPPPALPPFPVNGHGHFIPGVPTSEGEAWFTGSTYGRGDLDATPRPQDHAANLQRLRELVPATAGLLAPRFDHGQVRAWGGVRCTSADRRPLVGEVEPGLWVSTAMGSRGLTFATLCGEIIAARLHDEPLPLELRLARTLEAGRQSVRSA